MEPSQKTIEMVFGFPRKGEVYGTFDVLDSTFDPSTQTWSVTFAEEIQKKYAIEALRTFIGKQAIFAIDNIDYSIEFPMKNVVVETIRNNPPGAVQTRVSGNYTAGGAFQNPISVADFNADMDKMTVSNPKKHFRVYPAGELHSKKFRDQLFKFVTRRGESYGWVANGEIYHRKGSLVMPYVKINKHIEKSVVSYHTHPSKDEPSLTSPDDIQWYMDAAYKWGIRHFYTIMKDRLDHFEFIVKGDTGRKRYLKMDEGKFVDDLGAMLDKAEKEYKDKDDIDDYQFCERVTRAWIKDINSKFSHLVEIKYHHHIRPGAPKKKKVLANPGSDTPFPHTSRIKVDDKYLSIALNELKGIDYDWIHYGGDEFSHTMYVYWWLKYHFLPKADNTDRLWLWEKKGLDSETRDKVRKYLQQEVEDGWTNADCLLMLGLFHDIAKKREKEQKIHHSILGADMFKEEIAPELKLPTNLTERLYLMLQSDVGRKNITEEQFQTIAGDLYPVAKMFHMADRTAHHPYMYTIAARMARREGVLKTGEYGDAYIEMANKHDILELVKFFQDKALQNPPPKIPTSTTYSASYDIAIDPDTAEFLFQEYDPRKVPGNDGKTAGTFMMTYRQGLYLKMVLSDGYVASATLGFKYPGNLNITGVPVRDDYGLSGAREVYERVGQVLEQAYEVNVEYQEAKPVQPETFDVVPASDEDSAVQPLTNPRPFGSTIVLAGAHGSGRREVARMLHHHGGYMLCPMHTTEPRKPGRVPNEDSVNHSHESFDKEVSCGEMKYWTIGADGHKYGYTREQLSHPKTVMYTTPRMAMKMKEAMPKITIVFLDNKDSVKRHANRLANRNGVTHEMAKATAKRKHTLRNARHNFDKVVPVQKEDYKKVAMTLINPRIPKKYEGQDPSEHSDLYTDEDPKGTIKGLGFKDKATAEKSINIIKRSGKTHAHKIQAAMAMEQRARFHPNATPGIKAAQKVYAKFIEEMKRKTKARRNPAKTPEGRKIPKRYLKGLNKEEMAIAAKEIDKGYKYDIDDPEAYEEWKSDIKAKARGYKTVPSKYKKKFIEMYGPLPEKGDFLTKISKATGIKKSILREVEKKGLAAWRTGHRVGANQHAWARGRVYSFVTLGNTVMKGNKKMGDYQLAVKAGLIKENPPEYPDSVKESLIVLERMQNPDYEYFELTDITPVSAFTKYLDSENLYYIEDELIGIAKGALPFILKQKHHYNRPRPAEVNKKILPADSKTANTPAYPSGHAIQSFLLSNHLSEKYPKHAEAFEVIANRVADSRVSVGLHFPSDNEKAKELVQTYFTPKQNPPIEVMPRTNDLNTTRFINLETDEDVTGKLFDGATMNAGEYPNLHVGKELNLSSKLPTGIPKKLNIAKMGNERVIVFDGGRLLAKKVIIDAPVYLETSPFKRREPSGFIVTSGRAHYDEKAYTVSDIRITRWDDSVIPMLRPPYFIYDEVTIQSSPVYGPLPNPSKQPKASFDWLEKFTAWVELVNMKNKELKEFLDSDPWGKKAGINRQQAKDFGGISRGRFSASRILIMRKKLGLTGPKDYIKAGPMIIRNYYELAQKKWSEADWEWCKKQVSFNSRTRGQRGPYTDEKGRPTRKLTSLWVWGHDPWRYARKIEKRKTMPKCPDVPWIGRTEKRMYGTTEYKYPEVESNPPFRRPRLYHGSSVNNLKILKPHKDKTIGREVVFATPNYEYALAMSIPSTNDDFDIGYVNGEFYIEEQYEDAFDLLKQAAYMYEVDARGFYEHPQFPSMERIIEVSIPVKKAKRIPNVYQELRRIGANLIPYR